MNRSSRLNEFILRAIVIVYFVVVLSPTSLCKVRQSAGEPQPAPDAPGQARTESRYDTLLAKYHSVIGNMERKNRFYRVAEFRDKIDGFANADREISGSERAVVRRLLDSASQRRTKRIDFDGEVPENEMVVPTSDASARIFEKLMDVGVVDRAQLLGMLLDTPSLLSKEWLRLINRVVRTEAVGSPTWRYAVWLLYGSGDRREEYRAALVRMASKEGTAQALSFLFFRMNPRSGEEIVMHDRGNDGVLSTLAHDKGRPEIVAMCAKYAFATGNPTLAQELCEELLSMRYRAQDVPRRAKQSEEDDDWDGQLARARQEALSLLFSDIRTDGAFKLVYDLSQADKVEAEAAVEGKLPKGTRPAAATAACRLDIQNAQSLIEWLEGYKTAGK
jgi:hypothetical protein